MAPRYEEILQSIRVAFPQPVSDKIHDAYFGQSVMRALHEIDHMKEASRSFLGVRERTDYADARRSRMPEAGAELEDVIDITVSYLNGLTIWGHPLTMENVVPPTTIPSIVGVLIAAIYNPNVIWDEYSHKVAEAEVEAVSMVADLVGFNPETAGGVFTFGGTGTILYGIKMGIMKLLPDATERGVRQDLKVVASDASHYSTKANVLNWLGLGTDNLVQIKSHADNSMCLEELENTLRSLIAQGDRIACIVATAGTTDAFGIDDVEGIVAVRDRLVEELDLDYRPHLHADAVIGWIWSVFNDYDFPSNPLGFDRRTLRSLSDSSERIRHLGLADSVGIDFHKTAYAPYVSSLVLVPDRGAFDLLSRDRDAMPYLYQFGEYHPGVYTLECSRNGGGILAALANLKLLGREGFQALLGHLVEMAEQLRVTLESEKSIHVLNDYNYGPVTLFRVYQPGTDARRAWEAEAFEEDRREQLLANNYYSQRIFDVVQRQSMESGGVNLGLTSAYRYTEWGDPILALKSFLMSPFTDADVGQKTFDAVTRAQRTLSDEGVGD